ncbi:putative Synembryn [Fasciolopsis buskii]|uniref:Putative Synembryn n=1 Tax=Fasciolopsis buskii TaxID=27845 RepID=A0A8E0RZP0_9TREM|nr:putative Synembryn [Fasciolopsis buski]
MSAVSSVSLSDFAKANDGNFTLNNVDCEQKEAILEKCIRGLDTDGYAEVTDCLSCVRILSRDENSLNRLAENNIVESIYKFAFHSNEDNDPKKIIEALKALSNIIFKRPSTIPFLRTLGIVRNLTEHLKLSINRPDRNNILLIDLKLLFILSGLEPEVRSELASDPEAFALFANLLRSFQANSLSSLDVGLISEALKAAYNIGYAMQNDSNHHPTQQFDVFVPILSELLLGKTATPSEHFQLVNHIVNFLNIVPKRYFRHLLRSSGDRSTASPMCDIPAIDVLLEFLSHQMDLLDSKDQSEPDASSLRSDELLCPIFNVLIKGARGSRAMRKYCRLKILPHLGEEVRHLPEEGSTLRNRLCRLLTYPLQGVSELDALLLFVLCKEDIGRAVKYTGFGNFAGFLASHALLGRSSKRESRATTATTDGSAAQVGDQPTPSSTTKRSSVITEDDSAEEYSTGSSESDTEEYNRLRENINPITGRWELPRPNPMEGMSEEQKECTAMELVNQIDRLQRSGLIQPGVIGDDGRIRPAEHVLELLENTKIKDDDDGCSGEES